MVVVVVFIAGDQLPEIPFNETFGKTGIELPAQIGAIGLKTGTVLGTALIITGTEIETQATDESLTETK